MSREGRTMHLENLPLKLCMSGVIVWMRIRRARRRRGHSATSARIGDI